MKSEPNNCMNIKCLLDAAAVIDDNHSLTNELKTWDELYQFYCESIAPILNDFFQEKDRFGQILKKNTKFDASLNNGMEISLYSNYNDSYMGVELPISEALKELVKVLYPKINVSHLIIHDDRLEDLRISHDYKLLRAVLQLLGAPQFLPLPMEKLMKVGDGDHSLYQKLASMYQIIYRTALDEAQDSEEQEGRDFYSYFSQKSMWEGLNYLLHETNSNDQFLVDFERAKSVRDIPLLTGLYYHYSVKSADYGADIRMNLLGIYDQCDCIAKRLIELLVN